MFVFPDLKIINDSLEAFPSNISSDKLWDYNSRIIVLGDEQSGKSSLAKRLFLDAISYGFLPLLIEGTKIRNSQIDDYIRKLVSSTYKYISPEEFLQRDNLVCILDNLSTVSLNKKAKNNLVKNLNSIFSHTILLAEEAFIFVIPDFSALDDYKKLEILPLTNVLRGELIDKWVSLELTEEVDDQQIWQKKDELRLHVDSLVRKNVVPAKPFHILMLLQSFDTMTTQGLELTAYGHCYQYLIYQALENVHVKQTEIDTYLNVLSELGGAILDSLSESLDKGRLDEFFWEYSCNYLQVDQEKVINDLVNSFILQRTDTGIKFRYRYLFYFFAAKKMADSLQRSEKAKIQIQHLVNTIHLEKSSNIVLFLTHHSKDPWILDEILLSVMAVFSGEEEVTLEKGSLAFIEDFIKGIPELILENRDAKQERLEEDKQKDMIEQQNELQNDHLDENQEQSELIAKINKVFRSIEVCGQILRNRLGSLERKSLEFIYEESLSVSLRFLSAFLKFSELAKEESNRKIKKAIEKNPKLSNSKITREIESFYIGINYMVIISMLYKISYFLGSSKGREIYIKVTEEKDKPVFYLIQEIIELQFEKKLDFNKIENLYEKFAENHVCNRLLKYIILRHCYMHDIGFRERQRIASKLNIPIDLQRSITASGKNINE